MRVAAGLLAVSCLVAVFALVAAGATPRLYAGRTTTGSAVLAVMPRGMGRLRLRLTAAGAGVRRKAELAKNLEVFCLWTTTGADKGLGMGTAPIAGRLVRSASVRIGVAVSFHYVARYTCGLHIHRADEEPSAGYLRSALLAVAVKPER